MTALEEIKNDGPDRVFIHFVDNPADFVASLSPYRIRKWNVKAFDGGVEYVLASTLESLQRENASLQERTADYPTISARLHDREKARDAEQKACREAISRAEAAEGAVKRYRVALIAAKTRMRNCRGAIESNQVVDKDVHGSLQNGIRDIQDALASTGGEHHGN